jgi:WD40 repeat protein
VWAAQFSPDGKTLAAGGYREVRLYDVAGKTLTRTLAGHSGPVRCLAWSTDSAQLAAGGGLPGELGEVRLWKGPFDATNPAKPAAEMKDHRDVVEGLAFSAAGDALVTASDDERALAFALTGNSVVGRMQDHTNRVVSVAFSPGDKYVATGSLDKTVKIWSGKDYKPLANLDDTGGKVFAVTFLPNGLLAEGGEDGNLRLFRLQESKTGNLSSVSANLARNFGGNRTPILALAASAKGNWLVSGGEDHVVNVYDFASGNRKYQLKESPEAIYSLAISPDGTLIAAGCRDGKIRLWTTADGKPAGEL